MFGIVLFKLNILFFSCVRKVHSIDSLPVSRVRGVFRGSIFFSLVLIQRIPAYLEIEGGPIFFRHGFFLAVVLCTNWCTSNCMTWPILPEIECNKFVWNKFVWVLVQIDIIQSVYTNCIISYCTKTNTHLFHTMEQTALICFLDFLIQEGDLTSRTRVFTIPIGQVFAYLMDIAAMVKSNRCPSKKMFPNLFLHLAEWSKY